MNVAVIGTGYVGLVAGSCLADSGNDVVCVDVDKEKIERLQNGYVPIYEPGLPEILERNIRDQRLIFTTDIESAVQKSFVILITVGTPPAEDGSADIRPVLAAARDIGRFIDRYKVVVTKSTVPIGTTERVRDVIREQTDKPFDVVSNPEFLKEGGAVEDFLKPDRIIIGADDVRAAEVVRELYAPFLRTGNPVLMMDIKTAELTKYAANAALATRISFMNEVANLCERLGTDIDMVRKGLGSDSRIGTSFLFPGVGYGGSCFPKDVRALLHTARQNSYSLQILEAVDTVNSEQPVNFVERIRRHFEGKLEGKKIAVWGLSFKPRTNDMREAASVKIINALIAGGAQISAYDPEAMEEARKVFESRVGLTANNYECLEGADALVLATEWQAFRNPNFEQMKRLMRTPVVFDGRNIYDPARMRQAGFTYYAVGRP